MTTENVPKSRPTPPVAGRISRFAYRFFRWYDRRPHDAVEMQLYKADIRMLPGMYVGSIVFTAAIATAAAFAGSWFIFTYIVPSSLSSLMILAVTGCTLGCSLVALPTMTSGKINSKKTKIETNLPFLLAYMATLSSAGMNPIDVIRQVAIKDFGAISSEFKKIVYRFDVLGEDIISAINHVATVTASPKFHDMLIGISNIIVSGGSLKGYCEQESKSLFDDKKNKLKSFIDSLAAYSEGYLGGVLVTIIMGVIGIVVIGALGIKILPGFGTQDLFLVFIFFVVPFVNIMFLGMLELKYSGGE
jgi:flagellar protein FlaJ